MKYYNFFFYKFYKFMLKVGKNDIPEWNAIIIFSLWVAFYVAIFLELLSSLMLKIEVSKVSDFITFLFIVFLNHLYFIRGKRYEQLREYFETTGKMSGTKGTILITLFLMLPFVQLIYVLLTKVIFV
jgi:hypothetical protein